MTLKLTVVALWAVAGAALAAGTPQLRSAAFDAGASIPVRYTCDGANLSPPLRWTGMPDKAQSLALVLSDPDAPGGVYVHWVLYNLPVSVDHLAAGVKPGHGAHGARFGLNSAKKPAYTGPCPPSGVHHYHFKLYALDTRLSDTGHMTRSEFLEAIAGHQVGVAERVGTYKRQ